MKLYDIPRNTYVKVIEDEIKTPIASNPINKGDIILFSHVDGMYSFCININGEIVHLAAWTEVEYSTKEEYEKQNQPQV